MALKRGRGFTLLEIMVVVAIVGILAAIALPAYSNYVKRTNRSQAKQFLQDIANREEQYRLDQRQYTATLSALGISTIPTTVSPYYTITQDVTIGKDCNNNAIASPYYLLLATATPAQSSDGGPLCYDSAGGKTPPELWTR